MVHETNSHSLRLGWMQDLFPRDSLKVKQWMVHAADSAERRNLFSSRIVAPLDTLLVSFLSGTNAVAYLVRGTSSAIAHIANLEGAKGLKAIKNDGIAAMQSLLFLIFGVAASVASVFSPSILSAITPHPDEPEEPPASLPQQNRVIELEEQLDRQREEFQSVRIDLQARLNTLQSELTQQRQNAVQQLEEERRQFQAEIQREQAAVQILTGQNHVLQTQLQSQSEAHQGQISELQNQLQQLNSQNSEPSFSIDPPRVPKRKASITTLLQRSSKTNLEKPEKKLKIIYCILLRLLNFVTDEGIWRLTGDLAKTNEIKEQLLKKTKFEKKQEIISQCQDMKILTSLVKSFLDDFWPFFELTLNGNIEQDKNAVKQAIKSLSPNSFTALKYLLTFFKQVSANSSSNKMPIPNIAITLSPSFFKQTSNDLSTNLILIPYQNKVLEALLSNPAEFGAELG